MRALLYPSLLLASVGCLSEAAFNEKYAEKRCEEFERCVTADVGCSDFSTTSTTGDEAVCDFDKAAARECLRGAWTCDTEFEGYEVPIPPAACASVCGGTAGTLGTGADTGAGDGGATL